MTLHPIRFMISHLINTALPHNLIIFFRISKSPPHFLLGFSRSGKLLYQRIYLIDDYPCGPFALTTNCMVANSQDVEKSKLLYVEKSRLLFIPSLMKFIASPASVLGV